MPVTARLSRKFYETFGDEIANELVEWFNVVDAAYRTDLQELNDLHYARFDARLAQRLGEFEARMDARFAELEARMNFKLVELEVRMDARFERLSTELRAEFRTELAVQRADLIKWSFLFWLGMVLSVFVSRLI
jgi:hypothetical protein